MGKKGGKMSGNFRLEEGHILLNYAFASIEVGTIKENPSIFRSGRKRMIKTSP